MPELNVDLGNDFFYCKVRKEYLYQHKKGHGEYMDCIVFGVTSIPSRATYFNVILENGAQFAHLPVSALCHGDSPVDMSLDQLQLWDNFGSQITVTKFEYLSYLRVDAFLQHPSYVKSKKHGGYDEGKTVSPFSGDYIMTFDWWNNGFSEEPSQHKTAHLIKLDNGNFCLQPNNRTRWHDAAFTNAYKNDERPDFEVNTRVYTAERHRETVNEKFSY